MDDCKHGVLPDKENVIPFLIYGCYKIGRIDMGERLLKDMGKCG
jgi:pentatricopeptide repeat protein